MSKTDWEDYTKSKDYIKKTPKYTDQKGKKTEYCDSGWSKVGIKFFNDVRKRWRDISSRNMAGAWSGLEKDWAEYAEENNFENMYSRTVTDKDTSSDTPHDDDEGEGQDMGLPADRFDFKNEDCPWKKRDYKQEEDESDLRSSGSSESHTRPQKRARTRYASHPGRVSQESDYRATQTALDFDEGSYDTEGSFGLGVMSGV